ncbi:MAG: hypothetical protein ABJD11_13145 [Gemmatimonadota bacterium]
MTEDITVNSSTTYPIALMALASLTAFGMSPTLRGEDHPRSHYSAAMHGVINATSQGEATFGAVPPAGQAPAVFSLELGAYSEQGSVLFTMKDGSRPTAGTYHVSDDRDAVHALIVTGAPSKPTGVFHANSGTLTITSSTATSITGSFVLDATGFLADSPDDEGRAMDVTGDFMADGK